MHTLFKHNGDAVFLQNSREKISYNAFWDRVKQVAATLKRKKIPEQSIIILHGLKHEETILLSFALWLNRLIVLTLNPSFPEAKLCEVVADTQAYSIITNTKLPAKFKTIQTEELFNFKTKFIEEQSFDMEIAATIVMTSGSSGKAKYVVHALQQHLKSADGVNSYFNTRSSARTLLILPLFHVAGLALIFRALLSGSRVCIPGSEVELATAIKQFRPTHISLVERQVQKILMDKEAVEVLALAEAIFIGGGPLNRPLLEKCLYNNWSVYSSYGLSEMASSVVIGYVKSIKEIQTKILKQRTLKIDASGEVWVSGDVLMLGYWQKGHTHLPCNEAGWYKTGDIASWDKKGEFKVLGRADNMFISGGENIYPEEIERCLLKIEGVERALVLAVDDTRFGKRPVAFVAMKEAINSRYLTQKLAHFLPAFKIPDRFLAWPNDLEEDIKPKRAAFYTYL